MVADLWGDAPFTNAFNPTILTPTYDKQEDLYTRGLQLLDSAILQIAKTDATVKLSTTNDLIYAGNRARWLQFAYGLKARMLLKVSKTPTFNAASVLTAVDNSFKSNADDAGMTVLF
jgi:hypothetical protein